MCLGVWCRYFCCRCYCCWCWCCQYASNISVTITNILDNDKRSVIGPNTLLFIWIRRARTERTNGHKRILSNNRLYKIEHRLLDCELWYYNIRISNTHRDMDMQRCRQMLVFKFLRNVFLPNFPAPNVRPFSSMVSLDFHSVLLTKTWSSLSKLWIRLCQCQLFHHLSFLVHSK